MRRNFLLFVGLAVMLTACTTYYQVFQVGTVETFQQDSRRMVYEDAACRITYDLWKDQGDLSFDFYNKTNQTLHLYLNECFILKNKQVSDFLQLDIHDRHDRFEGSVVSIPSGGYRHFICPAIQKEVFEFCHVNVCPSPMEIKVNNFSQDNTPLTFGVYLTYSLGQQSEKKMVKNNFYVNQVVNYHKRNFEQFHNDTVRVCDEEEVFQVQDLKASNKFYIGY
ncbi:MAG: hypothetical protein J5642_08110 [Bacteroidales bacterium]|nr:hypothetical protein [Bacteroidales bacterium]